MSAITGPYQREAFTAGHRMVTIRITDGNQFTDEYPYRLLGPRADERHPTRETSRDEPSDAREKR